MRKDITKKFLGKETRYLDKMLSKEIVSFISRKKINRVKKQIAYDEIEFRNVFSTEFIDLNTNNFSKSGDKIREIVPKKGKSIEFNMIHCEKGKFEMGSNNKNHNNPQRLMLIATPFLLGETEVTQELYELVMDYNPSRFKGKEDSNQRPVERVTWYDAIMFCNKLSILTNKNPYYEINDITYFTEDDDSKNICYAEVKINKEGANGFRLPRSKEWEYAARAGTNNKYAGTNDGRNLGKYAWFGVEWFYGSTHPVATKKPNEWGFYDMSGNVWEWCGDGYSSSTCVIRGGSWDEKASSLCSISLSYAGLDRINSTYGFRVSASL